MNYGEFFLDRWKTDESSKTTKSVDRMTIPLDSEGQFSENKA